MKTYSVRHSCGCCYSDIQFENDEAIQKAFEAAGYTSSGTIVNETGTAVHDVDTFYGYENRPDKSPLATLVDQLIKERV